MTTKTTKAANKSAKQSKAAKAAPKAKRGKGVKTPAKPVLQQRPSAPVTIAIPDGKKFRNVPIHKKVACLLAVLCASKVPMRKGGDEGVVGDAGTLLGAMQAIGYGQQGIGKGCGTLATAGLITREPASYYVADHPALVDAKPGLYCYPTETGRKVKLVQGDKQVDLATILKG